MTATIAWKPFYSVNEPSLDAQHKQILEIINQLFDAMERGDGHELLKPLLDRLVQYANTHFRHEERIMQEHRFPDFAEHKAIHDHLRKRTADLRANTSLITTRDLLNFVKLWWVEHIQSEDKAYAPYLSGPVRSGSRERSADETTRPVRY